MVMQFWNESRFVWKLQNYWRKVPSSGLEWTPLKREAVCVEYRCEDSVSWSDVGVIPLLIGVSPGRKITEKLPADELFITPASSEGDEHDSDLVSRNNGDPAKLNNLNLFSLSVILRNMILPTCRQVHCARINWKQQKRKLETKF